MPEGGGRSSDILLKGNDETCDLPHEDALIVTDEIGVYDVKRVLINFRSKTDVIFLDALNNMVKSEKDLQKVNFPLMVLPQQSLTPWGPPLFRYSWAKSGNC